MSGLFAVLAVSIVAFDLFWIGGRTSEFAAGQPAPITVRVPTFFGFSGDRYQLSQGSIVVARGEILDSDKVDIVRSVYAHSPALLPSLVAYGGILFIVVLMYASHLRRSHRGRLLRTPGVTLLLLLASALVAKVSLLMTSLSVMAIPFAAFALLAALVVDVSAALATGLVAAVFLTLLVPFDAGVMAVLLVQTTVAVLLVGDRFHKNTHIVGAGIASGIAAGAMYSVLSYLATGQSPALELVSPINSGLWAAVAGGVLSGFIAIVGKPVYQYLLGDITKSKLVELEDLSNPMLKQIAENSPGTWQHSLAMANMAEIAANEIGASGRLVRVGAYYHDLGKSLQPKYFIENIEPGEHSPHDRLPPEVSCDAIFAHVTEGIRLARKRGLPERIIDFMHMHHGDGLLEYFWAKCRENGNPNQLTENDFRYPGLPPQSRETAILAICDAVEAASRTLKKPDERSIENLVQRIVYGKLHLGQLDQSGLSMSDLRKISDSLRETIKHAHHGRIEYPWQRENRAAEEAARARAAEKAGQGSRPAASSTQRMINEPRLDSLDVPRPYWRDRPQRTPPLPQAPPIETAPTEPFSVDTGTNDSTMATVPLPADGTLPTSSSNTGALQPRRAEPEQAAATPPAPATSPEAAGTSSSDSSAANGGTTPRSDNAGPGTSGGSASSNSGQQADPVTAEPARAPVPGRGSAAPNNAARPSPRQISPHQIVGPAGPAAGSGPEESAAAGARGRIPRDTVPAAEPETAGADSPVATASTGGNAERAPRDENVPRSEQVARSHPATTEPTPLSQPNGGQTGSPSVPQGPPALDAPSPTAAVQAAQKSTGAAKDVVRPVVIVDSPAAKPRRRKEPVQVLRELVERGRNGGGDAAPAPEAPAPPIVDSAADAKPAPADARDGDALDPDPSATGTMTAPQVAFEPGDLSQSVSAGITLVESDPEQVAEAAPAATADDNDNANNAANGAAAAPSDGAPAETPSANAGAKETAAAAAPAPNPAPESPEFLPRARSSSGKSK